MGWYTASLDTPQSRTKAYNGVDLMKFICALMVIMIHCSPLADVEEKTKIPLYWGCLRLAVPFFFISAGYFWSRKAAPDKLAPAPCRQYLKRLIRIYLLWTAFYFPLSFRENIWHSENSLLHSMLWYAKAVLLVNGGYVHLWYLHALIVSTLLLMLLLYKKVPLRYILLISGALFAVGVTGESYPFVWQPLLGIPQVSRLAGLIRQHLLPTMRSGLFFGFFFMALGVAFSRCRILFSLRQAVIGFAASLLLLTGEIMLVDRHGWGEYTNNMYIGLVPAAFFLFYLAAHLELPRHAIWRYLRDMSSLLYYLHLAVLAWGEIAGIRIPNAALRYLAVLLATLALSHLVIVLSRRKGWTWLAKLYR